MLKNVGECWWMLAICWWMVVICWWYVGDMLAICWRYVGDMLVISSLILSYGFPIISPWKPSGFCLRLEEVHAVKVDVWGVLSQAADMALFFMGFCWVSRDFHIFPWHFVAFYRSWWDLLGFYRTLEDSGMWLNRVAVSRWFFQDTSGAYLWSIPWRSRKKKENDLGVSFHKTSSSHKGYALGPLGVCWNFFDVLNCDASYFLEAALQFSESQMGIQQAQSIFWGLLLN